MQFGTPEHAPHEADVLELRDQIGVIRGSGRAIERDGAVGVELRDALDGGGAQPDGLCAIGLRRARGESRRRYDRENQGRPAPITR
jgi:hypothetical protein